MQTRAKIFDDLAKVAGGAASTLSGLKGEIEHLVRQQLERFLGDSNMVPRDEFDAVKAMAARARTEQETMEKRVQALEKKLGIKSPAPPKPQAGDKLKGTAKVNPKAKPGSKGTKKAKPKK